ncbi:hypothetical protein BC940DRAFT_298427 [Gongronella butleri]|nr:hypothetical protein BC940DRAFT_298427 [Gongronella butleri]
MPGPRPLATKPEYSRGRLKINASMASSAKEAVDQDVRTFVIPARTNDLLLQPNTKRSRKLYRALQRDQQFLIDLKRLYQVKLDRLQSEHAILQQMCNYTAKDMEDVPALFDVPPYDGVTASTAADDLYSTSSTPSLSMAMPYLGADILNGHSGSGRYAIPYTYDHSAPSTSMDSPFGGVTTTESTPAPFGYDADLDIPENDDVERMVGSLMAGAYELGDDDDEDNDNDKDDMAQNEINDRQAAQDDHTEDDQDDQDDDDEEEEDEETARQALTYMLAHYGVEL